MLAYSLLIGSPTEIGLWLAVSVASPCLEPGATKEVFQDRGTCPVQHCTTPQGKAPSNEPVPDHLGWPQAEHSVKL